VSSQGCFAGKTTFIRMLHGSLKADDEDIEIPEFRVSYKPQKISPKFPGSVRLAISHSCVLPQSACMPLCIAHAMLSCLVSSH